MLLENDSLITERLILKVLDGRGAVSVQEYYLRNRDFLKNWEPWRAPEFYTLECQQRDLQNQREKINRGELFKVWLFKKDDLALNKVIGLVSLNNITRGYFQSALIGYGLDQSEVNKGCITEAARAVIAFAFEELKLHKLEANIMPHNRASLRVAEKLGFQQEGMLCKYLQINGSWQEHIRMVLNKEAVV